MPQRPALAIPRHRAALPAAFACDRSAADDGVVSITVRGALDVATVADVDASLRVALVQAAVVVLDLSELDFIDSSGAHLLLDADRRARANGGRLTVVRGSEVSWLLALLGLECRIELVNEAPARPTALPRGWTGPA